jgi:ABC-type multidrug transport system ATPase subunit/pSer/pThr/pTyr-binding forkhead associated (FHA) protein
MTGLRLEIEGRTVEVSPSQGVIIGRDVDGPGRVGCELVSRRHLQILYDGTRWIAHDLGTLNGTYLDGESSPASGPVELRPGTTLLLGDPERGARVRAVPEPVPTPSAAPLAAPGGPISGMTLSGAVQVLPVAGPHSDGGPEYALTSGAAITIGRADGNAIVIHDPMVSAHHARITPLGAGPCLVEDLRSTNGTFVDGARVDRVEAAPGSVISIGKIYWKVAPAGLVRIAQEQPASGPAEGPVALSVSGVSFTVPTSKQEQRAGSGPRKALLDDVTFNVPQRSLVAVIGPSGAGKSTMLKTMIGTLKPDQGQVLFNGLDMAVFAGSIADRVGMVPQDDLLHDELTARQALDYAARLRFPDDAEPSERSEAVEWALAELGLVAHADTRIRQLSGGQRKRVSTAMELLTKPDLLFLDEPTSGLDPNLDREVMELLRDLAHGTAHSPGGRTVVVITHSTDNLDKADLVLLLAPGGKVAYVGPPGGLRPYFSARLGGETTYSNIYNLIARQPEAARAEFAASPLAQPAAPLIPQQQSHGEASRSRRRLLPQTLTLLGRQARLMVSDRSLLVFTLALPVIVGLLTLAVRADDGFRAATETKAVGEPRILLVVLLFGAVLMGMVPSVRQLVGERPIFIREAGVGVRPSAYLASKIALLGVVCAIQSVLMVGVALALNPHPDRGVAWPLGLELFLVAFGTAWACSSLGLLLSGLVATSEQVMPLMVLVLMFQLVMCGGVLDVSGPGINQVSLLSPSRWGYAAGASSLDFNRTITCNSQVLAKSKEDEEVNRKAKEATDEANQKAADNATKHGMPAPTPEVPKVRHTVVDCATVDGQDRLWDAVGMRWLGNMLALGFWWTVYAGGTYLSLRRRIRV